MNEIQAQIMEMLETHFGLRRSQIEPDTLIFSANLLDSLSSLQLVMQLESIFGISISPLDVSIDDIDSVDRIVGLVERSQFA